MKAPSRTSSIVDELQASGRYTFTGRNLGALDGRSEVGLKSALRRLEEKRRVVSPRRGFFVIVPVEYQTAGGPPASWFVDDLMAFLGQAYYVGLLSAAAIHGSAHQQPMVFQVVTDQPTRSIQVGRSRIEFHSSHQVDAIPVTDFQTETGYMRVSTPEATALDLVHYLITAGPPGNLATVLQELAEAIDSATLVEVAALYPTPTVQRLGYLLELVGEGDRCRELASWLARRRRRRPALLVPGKSAGDLPRDPLWRVIANEPVEVDL